MKLEEAVKYASDLLLSLPRKKKVRIIGHVDADGIASASIVAISLARAGYRFHVSIKKTEANLIKEIEKEENDLIIFADIGSSYLKEMEKLKSNVIVLEHHLHEGEIPNNVIYVNARMHGIDGSREACGASVAYAFAIAIDSENKDLCQLAVPGIIGDKQSFTGWNKKIIEDGIGNGFIEEREEYIMGDKNLRDFLENSIEPYFTGFRSSSLFLDEIGIPPQKKFDEIDETKRKKLLSLLTIKLIEQGVEDIEWKKIFYYGEKYGNLFDLASKLNACARFNESGTGISLCFGDQRAFEKAKFIQEKYRDEIRKEMRELEMKEPNERENFIYFYVDKPSLAGVLAGLALKYLPQFRKGKPVFALSHNDYVDISARADEKMVENGINLGKAIKNVAEKIGGIGGGHPIAAGGKIKKSFEEKFLEEIDKELKK
ncbi:MAG TPA: DHH family phosphoesterase [Thermoplasmatales archaeon]|nr:DHH family phosphoesterase [Thermoplasmatales archaeon]